MSAQQDPILVQFAVPPKSGLRGPQLKVNHMTGLLHEPGDTTPFVEKLIAMGSMRANFVEAGTIITASPKDVLDPDQVRSDTDWRLLNEALETILTKGATDPEDPDLIRDELVSRYLKVVETQLIETAPDQPDPDLIRTECSIGSRQTDA